MMSGSRVFWQGSSVSELRLPVFDERERTDASPASHEESSFTFLNRIAGDFWHHARQLIENWCSHLPTQVAYADMRGRLRSRNDSQFNSAFLELYLHEALLRSGHTVEIHPHLESTERQPDFYAEKDGVGFYIEAISPGVGKEKASDIARKNRFIDVVNRLDEPDFLLSLRSLTVGRGEPRAARLRTDLRRWLRSIDPDAMSDRENAPRFTWAREDWSAEFSAIPVRKDGRRVDGTERRAIAIYAHEPAEWVNDATTITKALDAKHGEYGALDKPFVIAVGLFIQDTDRWHSTNAFYGPERIILSDGEDARSVRQGDGYFGAPQNWQHTNVSGVLLVNQLQPYHVHKAETTLWVHPGSSLPISPFGMPGDTVNLDGNQVTTTSGAIPANELFGLPPEWPPGDPWPSKG